MVSLGSEIFIHGMVLPALILLKGSLAIQLSHQLGFSKFIWAPQCIFSWIPTGGIVLVISLDTQIVIN